MLRSRRLLILGTLLCSIALAIAGDLAPSWTDDELRVLAALGIDRLGAPPADPSNAVADDPRAARFGHALFFDERLGSTGAVSCASCHRPELWFTDGLPRGRAVGVVRRNTPSIVGTSHNQWFYADGRKDSQWSQALAPLEDADEHAGARVDIARAVLADEDYRRVYEALFGAAPDLSDRRRFPSGATPRGGPRAERDWGRMNEHDRIAVGRVFANIGKVLAAYQRVLRHGPSRFDRYLEHLVDGGEATGPLTDDEIAGLRIFIGERGQCLRCHNGPALSNGGFHNIGVATPEELPADRGRIATIGEALSDPFNCLGLYSDAEPSRCLELQFMKRSGDEMVGAFKVPSLRNVGRTAPYMHAGQMPSLRRVIEHYGDPGGGGVGHPEISPRGFSEWEIAQLVSFLRTLDSDPDVDERWLRPPARGKP